MTRTPRATHCRRTTSEDPASARFRRILVPHDLSPHADRALRVAAELAGPDGELVVLHVVVLPVAVSDFPVAGFGRYISSKELAQGGRRQLQAAVARGLRGREAPAVTLVVDVGDPYRSIVRHSQGMDLVVISTAGRTGLAHLVIGSVAEKVVRHSPVPVLSLRPHVAMRMGFRARSMRRRAVARAG